MKKLQITILDLIHNSLSNSLYQRYLYNNFMSIMPQVVAVWCKEEGHNVNYSLFTGIQDLETLINKKTDIVIIGSFTYSAQLAYAISSFFKSKGIPTVLGGPHARCYPEDACNNFDYVLGLTDKKLFKDLLSGFGLNKKGGIYLSSLSQPESIPGVRERWELIESIHGHYSIVKSVPMIGSFGCPYKCDYCVDSEIPYKTLDMDMIKGDLQFLVRRMKKPRVSWYDPNFGINFNLFMETIESAVPSGSVEFIAETSLSVLSEDNVKRLKKNGFVALLPGIESWFGYGNKSKVSSSTGMDKVLNVADQVNMIQRYIPHVQTNFMFGFDTDSGDEPFELTKRFIDLVPGAYPAYALLSVFGQTPETNLRYIEEGRVIPFPFHYMQSVNTMNIIPRNYTWRKLYDHFIDLLNYSFSGKAMYRRFNAVHEIGPKWVIFFLSITGGGWDRRHLLSSLMMRYKEDEEFRLFVSKETTNVPGFMVNKVRKDLGPLWQWLPDKSLSYSLSFSPAPKADGTGLINLHPCMPV